MSFIKALLLGAVVTSATAVRAREVCPEGPFETDPRKRGLQPDSEDLARRRRQYDRCGAFHRGE